MSAMIAVALMACIWIVWQADPETINRMQNGVEYMPDGTTIIRTEIDGHQYLKTDSQLTHSASCNHPSHNSQ